VNRLAAARSPYLLQHAANPVDWFPWGEEAFRHARETDRPIFLSIGYSTCHWCHVMEHESFENVDVAAVLNAHFVSVKVDREERPDVDRVYMAFVQATTGSGGWPMSVWLTPALEPFYGGTYFPPTSRWGRPGFVDILREIARVWREERQKLLASADAIVEQLKGHGRTPAAADVPGTEALSRIVAQFRAAFDHRHGGFGDAPKFPRPSELLFLLREWARTQSGEARDMALASLRAMAAGGMRDHVGGGFHRYSVDAAWRVPHFEKMLYDQAQLTLAYLEAAQASGDRLYLDVADDTLQYVMREMTDPDGGFYSAEDADSVPPEAAGRSDAHKAEGAFYLFTSAELDEVAGPDAPIAARRFGIEPGGNAPIDPQQEFTGKNLLYLARTVDELADEFQMPREAVSAALGRARLAMFQARLARPRPHLDDKILTAWNGLMIGAFARAARVSAAVEGASDAEAAYRHAARRAATFLRATMWNEGTRTLVRRYRAGHAEIDGYAEDYACLIFGLIELLQADPDPLWLEWAVALQRRQDELFWDDRDGGWFSTTGRDASVLVRMKEDYDGAEPAASSMAVSNLLALVHLVDDPQWTRRIEETLRAFGLRLEQVGRGVPMMAAALSQYHAGGGLIVIVGDGDTTALARAVAQRYRPFMLTLHLVPASQRALAPRLPVVASMRAPGGAAAFMCRDFTCGPPAASAAELEQWLDAAEARGTS
jgi:hypothetical protein